MEALGALTPGWHLSNVNVACPGVVAFPVRSHATPLPPFQSAVTPAASVLGRDLLELDVRAALVPGDALANARHDHLAGDRLVVQRGQPDLVLGSAVCDEKVDLPQDTVGALPPAPVLGGHNRFRVGAGRRSVKAEGRREG